MDEKLLAPLRQKISEVGLSSYETVILATTQVAVVLQLDGSSSLVCGEIDFSPQKNWRNLLRLDSITELDFTVWDAGYFNFLIHFNDLDNLDFPRVYAAVESS